MMYIQMMVIAVFGIMLVATLRLRTNDKAEKPMAQTETPQTNVAKVVSQPSKTVTVTRKNSRERQQMRKNITRACQNLLVLNNKPVHVWMQAYYFLAGLDEKWSGNRFQALCRASKGGKLFRIP